MGRHPLVSFFVMAFAFSWIVWIPYVLSIWHALPVNSFSVLSFPIGTFLGPALAAFLMTGLSEGDADWGGCSTALRSGGAGGRGPYSSCLAFLRCRCSASLPYPERLPAMCRPSRFFWCCIWSSSLWFSFSAVRLRKKQDGAALLYPAAAALWSTAGNPAAGCALGRLASSAFPYSGPAWRSGDELCNVPQELPRLLPGLHRVGHHFHLGLQPQPRQLVPRCAAACQCGRKSVSKPFSCCHRDQHKPLPADRFRASGSFDCLANPWSPWIWRRRGPVRIRTIKYVSGRAGQSNHELTRGVLRRRRENYGVLLNLVFSM